MLSSIRRRFRFLAGLTGSRQRQDAAHYQTPLGVASSERTSPGPSVHLPGQDLTAQPEEPLSPVPLIRPAVEPIDNKPWSKLVGECVDLFDEIDSHLDGLDPGGREMAEHVCLRLQEILQRCGVELIDRGGPFERTLHQTSGAAMQAWAEAPKVQILSPGFRIGRRILRRARVESLQESLPPTTGESS